MKIFIKFYVLFFLVSLLNGCGEGTIKMDYPETKKLDLVETIFGERIEDPYRWLEDFTSIDSREWVEKQNNLKEKIFVVAGGVAANKKIRSMLINLCNEENYNSIFPPIEL